MKVLDIGCGAGILCEGLGRLGMGSVTGIDPTDRCINLAEDHLKFDKDLSKIIKYRNMTLEALKHELEVKESKGVLDENSKYDLVCCSEVIEHVD
jgi:2-polyprenyl-6-hydroxyphenyl methylase/3-demethylubiquinone-9 3-methyltransferase